MGLVASARNAVPWTAVITGSALVSRAVITLAAARFVPPYDLGLFAIVGLALGFAGLFADGGLAQSVVTTREIRPEQLSSLHWCNVLFGAAVGLAMCLAAPAISFAYAEPRLADMLLLAALSFAISPFGQISQTLLQKQLGFATLGRIEVASNAAGVLAALGLLAAGVGIYALILAQLATALLRTVLLRGAGLMPATWFICLVNVAVVPLTYFFMLRPTLGSFSLDYARSFLPAISLALGMAVAVRLLATTAIHPRLGMLAAQLALGAVLYGGMTVLFRRGDVGKIAGLVMSRP